MSFRSRIYVRIASLSNILIIGSIISLQARLVVVLLRMKDCYSTPHTTNTQVFSLGCFSLAIEGNEQLVSMIIAEEQPLSQLENEVGPVLASASPKSTVLYVISLGMRAFVLHIADMI